MKLRPLIPTLPAGLALASHEPAQDRQPTDAKKAAQAQVDAYVAALNKGDAKAVCRGMSVEDTP
jgi:hypothetical protein